ncbi:hypothetical protein [Agrococcus sp. ARC_14]|uniref:immunity protein Imm33 domain-containing protein n=1 Tax=Agrococcus sp. ARC_14 TaxID=2919927 RepID=UPI001F05FCDE|nr:hypothetical protein [Agrococcus sp. ARC_14]MCH1881566.1 hypothetical protein [Agrococcus sp. ARC_14]
MTPTTTTTTISVDGRSLSASAVPDLQGAIDALLARFADIRGQWSDGLFVWSTWSPIVMTEQTDGFVLETPDYAGDAFNDRTTDLSLALQASDGVVRVLNAANRMPQDVRFNQTVEAVKGWEQHDRLIMTRSPGRDDRDSGWFIDLLGVERSEPWTLDDVVVVPLWQVAMARPAAARVLALPLGIKAAITGDAVEMLVDEQTQAVLAERPL